MISHDAILWRNNEILKDALSGVTLKNAGKDFGISPERVRQIINKSVRLMRLHFPEVVTYDIYCSDTSMASLREHKDFWIEGSEMLLKELRRLKELKEELRRLKELKEQPTETQP